MNKIALIGRSGAGKTEIAKYLELSSGFSVCNTGKRCRQLGLEFFDSESKEILQKITDSFNQIEKGVWLKVALKTVASHDNIIIDSIRFSEDLAYAKAQDFQVWKIECPQEIRLSRLRARGQIYTLENELHNSETELDQIVPDVTITNSKSLEDLHHQINQLI